MNWLITGGCGFLGTALIQRLLQQGGHAIRVLDNLCIGVDPYYLTHKAQAIGYHPEIILAGRRLNDSMGTYVVAQLVKAMTWYVNTLGRQPNALQDQQQ